ncbi:MAG: Jag N-terminal domain-containing protein [Clostridia bacterium]|nr:Jag N-terminal domain-containing protein [Clostridia bacterium]
MEENEMMSIESSGKSVDEAIFKGLQQMGISIDEVSIEIIQTETKGILGIGAKPAKVRLTKKPPEEYEVPDYMKRAEERRERRGERNDRRSEQRDRRREGRREKDNRKSEKPAKAEENNERTEENTAEEKTPREEKPVRENRPRRERKPEPTEPVSAEEAPAAPAEEPAKVINYTVEAAEGNPAAEFVKGLITRMGAEGTVLAAQDEDCLRLRIDSEMMGLLIGHRGETLDAMQYITGLVINKNRKTDGYTRVTLNTEEYREKREETLRRLARKVASQVRVTGRPRALEPMNPYERRVLHSALQNNPDVTTHSEGEEPNRRVVVTPRRKAGYNRSTGRRRSRSYKKAEKPAEEQLNVETVVENIENSVENAD